VGQGRVGQARSGLRFGLPPLPCPSPHGARPAGEAERDEIAPQQGGVAAALRPASFQVVEIGGKSAHPRRLAPERWAAGPEPAPDRLALGAKLGGDARDGSALRAQPCSVLVTGLPPGQGSLAAPCCRVRQRAVRLGCRGRLRRRAVLFAGLLRRTADGAMVAVDHGADGIAEVAQQVPAVGDLDRIRRTLAHAVRVGAGSVARDDLDPGVLTKPSGQGFGLPVGQQVQDLVALQVDQGRPVAVATAPGPVIDGADARRGRRLAIIAGRAGGMAIE